MRGVNEGLATLMRLVEMARKSSMEEIMLSKEGALVVTAINDHELIAEMVGALEDCLKKGSKWHPCDEVVMKAKAVLAKARERASGK